MANGVRTVHSNALPNYQNAIIPRQKLENYALDPSHPEGKHKARVFKSALGFDQSNWEMLAGAIRNELPFYDAGIGQIGPWGVKHTVVLSLVGTDGRIADVVTVWITRPSTGYPSLVTTYVR